MLPLLRQVMSLKIWQIFVLLIYNFLYTDGTVLVCEVSKTDFPQLVPHTSYHGHQSSVNCVKFHPTNDLMLTASGDGTAHIWKNNLEAEAEGNINVDDGINQLKTPQLELKGHAGVVISATWLAGLEQCVTASWDHMGNIYDYNTGEMVVQLVGHDQELTDVCAHESSRLIVTSSNDTTFRLWDFRDAIHSVSVFQGHNRAVTSTSFLGNDKIVSGGDDRNVKVWDVCTLCFFKVYVYILILVIPIFSSEICARHW